MSRPTVFLRLILFFGIIVRTTVDLSAATADSTVDVGTVRVGDDIPLEFRIRNTHSADLVIDSLELADTRHYRSLLCTAVTSLPAIVAPSDSLDLRVSVRIRHNVFLNVLLLVHGHAGCRSVIHRIHFNGSATAAGYAYTDDAEQSKLFDTLRSRVTGHTSLGYKAAREVMFGKADNVSDSVECIYTGKKLKTAGIPPNGEFNTEHSWPQSFGSSAEPNKSDIYHLYPTNPNANSMRANYPFGMISKVWKDAGGGSRLGFTAKGDTVFEPRDVAKGNIARGLFYYFLRYGNLFNYYQSPYAMDADLRRWNEQDPPDAQERRRGDTIAAYQGKRNPFIDYPQFIERMDYVPVNRSAITIVPAVQTVGDDVSGAVLIAHVLNRGTSSRRIERVDVRPSGFLVPVVSDSLIAAHAFNELRLILSRSSSMPSRFVVTAWLSDSTSDSAVVTICGPSDVHDDTDALPARASVRPHPVRDEAEVMVCKDAQSVEWAELVDLQGRRICALETSLYRGDGGTYVRLGRDMLNGSHGARGAVFVRAGVAGRVVTRAVVIE
ncbi:MAG: endonuclease [Candidatus Kapaibacterium sp.]